MEWPVSFLRGAFKDVSEGGYCVKM